MPFNNQFEVEGDLKIGFIGGGNMAQAIIGSLIDSGTSKPECITVSAPSDRNLAPLRDRGILTTHNNDEVINASDVVFLCVKPHIFSAMNMPVKPSKINKSSLVLYVSVMAGLTLDYLHRRILNNELLPGGWIVRTMPNTPSLVSEGVCVYAGESGTPKEILAITKTLLANIGLVREVPENLINAAAAVAGSGPAYMYVAIEALADGGVKMGLPRELAMSLAAQTLRGAATMVQKTGKHPGQLKDEVCSPGGTTIAAIHALEKQGFRNALINAVEAGTNRAHEIAEQNTK